MLKTKVNGHLEFEFEEKQLGKNASGIDLIKRPDGSIHLIHENRSYRANLIEHDPVEKTMVWQINGRDYLVKLEDRYDQLLKKLGMTNLASSKVSSIKAPMPGLVFSMKVAVGDEIKKGDTVLILEAMKMENIIKAPVDAIIKSIDVNVGDSVEKNQVMIQLD